MKNAAEERTKIRALYEDTRSNNSLTLSGAQIAMKNAVMLINKRTKATKVFVDSGMDTDEDIRHYLDSLGEIELRKVADTFFVHASTPVENLVGEIIDNLYI